MITAVNVQHLESLHDQVLKITGTDVTERIPDQLLKLADEVVNVDLTVGELRGRLEEGKIYDPAKVPTALANFFQAENLLQLRRLAVREVAQLLGRQVESDAGGAPAVLPARRNDDRLLACINSNDAAAKEIIRKTSRLADRFSAAAWYVLYVQTGRETADRIGLATQRHLLNNLQLATELGGPDFAGEGRRHRGAIRRVAQEKEATLLVCGITGQRKGPVGAAQPARRDRRPAPRRGRRRTDLGHLFGYVLAGDELEIMSITQTESILKIACRH